jgi:hypothetical protein
VHEDKPRRTWELAPLSLSGEPERFEVIARSLVDPPLYVVTHEIEAEAGDGTGYIFLEIPPSSVAPHMVDGVYYGRGDKTRSRLSDAEVLRHHSARIESQNIGDRLLDEEVSRDPVPMSDRSHGHLYLIAHPATSSRTLAKNFIREQSANPLWQLINEGDANIGRDIADWAPTPGYASAFVSRPRGVARCSPVLQDGRQYRPEGNIRAERSLVDIEVREDGGIRILVGRMTERRESEFGQSYLSVQDGLTVAYAHRLIKWASDLSSAVGYRGSWMLGLEGNGLRGAESVYPDGFAHGQGYSENTYREVSSAHINEMRERPRDVAERLVGPLLRSLGSFGRFHNYLEYPSE